MNLAVEERRQRLAGTHAYALDGTTVLTDEDFLLLHKLRSDAAAAGHLRVWDEERPGTLRRVLGTMRFWWMT